MAPKVYAHVLMYSSLIGITTAAAVGLSKLWSKTEEEKNNELLEKYPELVKRSQDQKKNMQAFFNKVEYSTVHFNTLHQRLRENYFNVPRFCDS